MKTINKLVSIVLIVIIIFGFNIRADAENFPSPSGNAVSVTGPAPSGSSSNGGYPSRASLKGSRTVFVGLLVSLVEYDTSGSSPVERTLAKKILASGSIGSARATFKTMDYGSQTTRNTYYYSTVLDEEKSSSHTETAPESVIEYDWDISYKAPTRSAALQGVSSINYSDIDGNSIAWSIQKTGGINEKYFTSVEKIRDLLGVTVDTRNLDKYFIKYEPIYRTYKGVLDKNGGFAYPGTSEGINNIYTPSTGFRCGDSTGELKETTYTTYTKDPSDDNSCTDGYTYNSTKKKCVKTVSEDHYTSYPLYYKALYTYQKNIITGIPTSMGTVRESYKSYGNKLFNSTSGNAQSAIDDKGNLINNETDYFIGSSYKTAIAAANSGYHSFNSKYNKYLIVESGSESYADNKTLGLAFYSLSTLFRKELDCTNVCSGNRSSDDYLQCSQSYCDSSITYSSSEYATDLKRDCIINNCKYVPNNPIDCSPESTESPYNKGFSTLPNGVVDSSATKQSYCGMVSASNYSRSKGLNSYTGGYTSCKRVGDDNKISVNGTSVYAYGVSNTQNTYINVACKELTTVDFKDLSGETLNPGDGFEYYAKLYGTRECLVFFDTEQWKFDFASTHSLDTVRKSLLLSKVKAYNELINAKNANVKLTGTNVGTSVLSQNTAFEETNKTVTFNKNIQYVVDYAVDSGTITTLDKMEFDTKEAKAEVNTVVTEYVNQKPYIKGNMSYSSDDSESFNLDRTNISGKRLAETKGSVLTKSGEDTLYMYADYSDTEYREIVKYTNNYGIRTVNRYTYTGALSFDYEVPEVCVSDDNLRKVTKSSNGMCNSTKFGDKYSKRLYYTHLNATKSDLLENGKNHNVKTDIKIYKTNIDGTKGEVYLSQSDTCPYKVENKSPDNPNPTDIDDPDGKITCKIVFDRSATGSDGRNQNGQVCYNAEDVYFTDKDYSEVRMLITNETSNDENIDNYNMVGRNANGDVVLNVTNNSVGSIKVEPFKVTTNNGSLVSNSKVTVIGTVNTKLSDGTTKTYRCANEIILAKKSNGCSITKNAASNKYEVSGASGDVYITTGNIKNSTNNLLFSRVTSINGKYQIPDLNPTGNEIVVAYLSDGRYCQYIPTTCSNNSCHTACGPNYEESCVTNYCNSKGQIDGYSYYPTCKDACYGDTSKHSCEYYITDDRLKEDFEYVSNWCNDYTNLSKTTHRSAKECMSKCYKMTGSSVYRPINLNNPFPSSSYSSTSGYEAGKREVAKEWKINIDTIEEDRKDIAEGKKVEYLIELTPSVVKSINQNTNFLNNNLKDSSIYSTTTNSINKTNKGKLSTCSINESSRRYTGYCSEFIHKSEFTSIFKIVDGVKFTGEIYE